MARQYHDEEYFEQGDDEREAAAHRKSLIALAITAVLVIAAIVLVNRLRAVSAVQDCLITHATNCNDLVAAPVPTSIH